MPDDQSICFIELYFTLVNRIITITTADGITFRGYIHGYFYNDLDATEKIISHWKFVPASTHLTNNAFEDHDTPALLIPESQIRKIEYYDNQKVLHFLAYR